MPLVLERDRHECQLEYPGCTGRATTADHVRPRRDGGGDELENLRASCRHCNEARGAGRSPRVIRSAW